MCLPILHRLLINRLYLSHSRNAEFVIECPPMKLCSVCPIIYVHQDYRSNFCFTFLSGIKDSKISGLYLDTFVDEMLSWGILNVHFYCNSEKCPDLTFTFHATR